MLEFLIFYSHMPLVASCTGPAWALVNMNVAVILSMPVENWPLKSSHALNLSVDFLVFFVFLKHGIGCSFLFYALKLIDQNLLCWWWRMQFTGLEIKNAVYRIFLHGAGDEHEISSSKYTCYFLFAFCSYFCVWFWLGSMALTLHTFNCLDAYYF